jgi:hypothetical protein
MRKGSFEMPAPAAGGWRLPVVLTLVAFLYGCGSGGSTDEVADAERARPTAVRTAAASLPTLSIRSGRSRDAAGPMPWGSTWDPTDMEITPGDVEFDQYVAAIDKFTGNIRWRRPRDGAHAYSTPLLIEVDGAEQVVSPSGRALP